MPNKMPNLPQRYKKELAQNGWSADAFQLSAVNELQRLLVDLNPVKSFWPFGKKRTVQGVYLYGGVGRGKSMLMNLFLDEASKKLSQLIKKRPSIKRSHFHEFMIETHDWLHAHRGEGMDDLLPRYADHVAKQTTLICFDEFHVTDVVDAMILGRLFTALFERGIVLVATSNWAPDNLYEGGLQRDRFMPFIKLLNTKTVVLHLDSDTDYRIISAPDQDVYYFYPLNLETQDKIERVFAELSNDAPLQQDILKVKGREIEVESASDIARFTFAQLCERAYGAEDYIAIAQKYDTVFLTQTPRLGYDRRNEAKRMILLIDCLYEAKCRLVISAQNEIEKLYHGHDHKFEFDRTISRLMEMQSVGYHQERVQEGKGV